MRPCLFGRLAMPTITIAMVILFFPCAAGASETGETLTLPILTYHYVEVAQDQTDPKSMNLTIRPELFEEQLQDLQERGYQSLFVREIPALLSGAIALPARRIALTFDDGYEDFFITAFPLLQKYNMKATIFVVNDFIGKPGYLSEQQLRTLDASGLVEIGSHTQHHWNVAQILTKKARLETVGSKRKFEKQFARPVTSFAYPYGKYSQKAETLVRDAGFTAAVTTERGFIQSLEHLLTLKRIPAGAFLGRRKWRAIGDTP